MKAHEEYQRILREVQDTLEYELEGLVLEVTEQIVRHMEREGINRTGLAKRLGKTCPYVTKLLSGKPNMTLETVVKVARALNCEVGFSLQTKHFLSIHQGGGAPEYRKFTRSITLSSPIHEYTSAAAA